MILTPFTLENYKQGLINLLPKGKLWDSFRENTYLNKILEGFSYPFQQIDNDACEVIDEVFPGTTTNLLPVWQETVGLVASEGETIEQQRAEVVAKLTQTASLARSYYINYAKQIGFNIDIIEYSGIISGIYRCGDTVGTTDDYTYQFDITITTDGNIQQLQEYLKPILPAYISVYYLNT